MKEREKDAEGMKEKVEGGRKRVAGGRDETFQDSGDSGPAPECNESFWNYGPGP